MGVRSLGLLGVCGAGALLGMHAAPVLAIDGFNLFAFGSESSDMGGADVAFRRDTAALVTNPAGLVLIGNAQADCRQQFGLQLDCDDLVDVRHADSLVSIIVQRFAQASLILFALVARAAMRVF